MDPYTAQDIVDSIRRQYGGKKYKIYRALGGVWYLSDDCYRPIASRTTFEEIRQVFTSKGFKHERELHQPPRQNH